MTDEKEKKELTPEEEEEDRNRPLSLSEWAGQIRNKMQPKTKEVV